MKRAGGRGGEEGETGEGRKGRKRGEKEKDSACDRHAPAKDIVRKCTAMRGWKVNITIYYPMWDICLGQCSGTRSNIFDNSSLIILSHVNGQARV